MSARELIVNTNVQRLLAIGIMHYPSQTRTVLSVSQQLTTALPVVLGQIATGMAVGARLASKLADELIGKELSSGS